MVTYNGSSQHPDISQIQPLRVNTNATNIVIGNPNLQPYFNHYADINYNQFKPATGQLFYMDTYMSYTSGSIIANQVTDTATLRSTTQYVNAPKASYYYGAHGSFSQKIKSLDMQVGIAA